MTEEVGRIYLDHAATTAIRPEVIQAMWPFMTGAYGNPSSVHSEGAVPRAALDRAHATVGDVLGCRPGEIVFTGSGTEADNLAILGAVGASQGSQPHVVTVTTEHEAVLESCRILERRGIAVTYLPVGMDGSLNLDELERSLTRNTVLVSVMLANNEIGTIAPIAEISRVVRPHGILLHTDAVQGAGSLDLAVDRLGVDLLSISGHKIYGPKGVGALYVRNGVRIEPVIFGGGQERGRRSGTENVAGAVGLAVALALASSEREAEARRLRALRDRLIDGVLTTLPGTHLTGHPTERLPGHASFYSERVSGESLLVDLDVAGIACSSGSACSAGRTDPSHVLTAIGLPERLARNGVRMTLGRDNTEDDIERVLLVLSGIAESLRVASSR